VRALRSAWVERGRVAGADAVERLIEDVARTCMYVWYRTVSEENFRLERASRRIRERSETDER
jgi:hypothetical protein